MFRALEKVEMKYLFKDIRDLMNLPLSEERQII